MWIYLVKRMKMSGYIPNYFDNPMSTLKLHRPCMSLPGKTEVDRVMQFNYVIIHHKHVFTTVTGICTSNKLCIHVGLHT
jgi:hypothetical protein